MTTSNVSSHTTAIESQIDDRQELRELRKEMQAQAKERAVTKLQFADVLGRVIWGIETDGGMKQIAFEFMRSMSDAELEAWLEDARADFEALCEDLAHSRTDRDLDREQRWEFLGSLVQYGEHLLYNGSTSAVGEGEPYRVTAQPAGPRTRPTQSRARA
jgi:hypothetical protein